MDASKTKKIDGLTVKDCVGCGFCCIKTPCDLARRLNPSITSECTFLKWDDEKSRYVCGAYTNAKFTLQTQIKNELFIGEGCCCGLNTWRFDVKPRREKDNPVQLKRIELDPIFKMFLRTLSREFISKDSIYLMVLGTKGRLIDSGKTEEEAVEICKEITYILTDRSKRMEDFMG